MRYIHQHIKNILDSYKGEVPLTHFLKQYFRTNPKLGSRDRRVLSEMSYCYFRCAKAIDGATDIEQLIQVCLFLSTTESTYTLNFLPVEWQKKKHINLEEKVVMINNLGISVSVNKLINGINEISSGLDRKAWLQSLLHQPALFIRIRQEHSKIEKLLSENNIAFEQVTNTCYRLPNGAAIDKMLQPAAYVVQDASSQATGSYFKPLPQQRWWDCCSGAGGKSLMLKDLDSNVKLTVSDKRKTILHNLKERFSLYGHRLERALVLDMADDDTVDKQIGDRMFDNIICDVPCTGSGTWARTPEQAYYFDEQILQTLPQLQKSIAINAARHLKPGGNLYYITCSVFKEENEAVIDEIVASTSLQLQIDEIKLLNGIEEKADCLFIARLTKH